MATLFTLQDQKLEPTLRQAGIKLYQFEAKVSLAIDSAHIRFEDFINGYDGYHRQGLSGRLSNGIDYLICYGDNVKPTDPHFTKTELRAIRKDDLIDLAHNHGCDHVHNDDYTKSELIDEMVSVITHEVYYENHRKNYGWRDLDYDTMITGYAQGDACKVVYVGDAQKSHNATWLQHIFYDTPIDGYIEVMLNGDTVNDIYVSEFIEDEYAPFDKDEFIASVAQCLEPQDLEYTPALLDWLTENIDEHLDYS